MSKKPKKRNKAYQGEDAKGRLSAKPTVHYYTAVQRGPLALWWHEHRRFVQVVVGITLIVVCLGWLIFEAITRVF